MNLEKKFIDLIKNSVNKYLPEAKIFIFGSRARETNKKFSDIDIAIKNPNKPDYKLLAMIRFDLEESELPYKIDLSDYHDLDKEILSDAIEI